MGSEMVKEVTAGQNGESIPAVRWGSPQTVAFTGTAAASSAVGSETTVVRLHATEDCFVLVGADPTASSSNGVFLPKGMIDVWGITPGHKLSVIRASTSGTLYIAEGLAARG